MKILGERKATWAQKGDKENVNLIFEAFLEKNERFTRRLTITFH